MVSMTERTSIADLHDRAHSAALNARDPIHNWWNGSLETGLAAAAGSLHPPGASRRMGELALDGLNEWYDKEKRSRAIGEDAAALALGALATDRLKGGSKRLREGALETLETVLAQSQAPLAPLHMTLAAWALRRLISVDDASPWPELRETFPLLPVLGVDSLLVGYGQMLAHRNPDPRELARVLQDIPEVDPSEYGILLWVLWSGSLMLAGLVTDDADPDLEVVRKRRTEVFDAIAAEMSGGGSLIEVIDDFAPYRKEDEVEYEPATPDTFEMLMIDLALSQEMTGEPLRSPTEVHLVVERRQAKLVHFAAAVVELLATVATAAAVLVGVLLDARFGIIFGTASMTFGVVSLGALAVWNRDPRSRWPRRALFDATLALALLGAATVVVWAYFKPSVSAREFITIAVGLGGPIAYALIRGFVRPLVEGQRR